MKLFTLEEQRELSIEESTKGTYVAVRFSEFTLKDIEELQETLKVPNRVPREELHATVVYSRKFIPDLKDVEYNGYIPSDSGKFKLDVFNSKSDGTRCLVLIFQTEHLEKLHQYYKDVHGATNDYPTYTPHITLSYDIGDMEFNHKEVYFASGRKIEMVKQYVEELEV